MIKFGGQKDDLSEIKKLAVSNLDYKIHFALNCGGKICPPIRFYESKISNC